MGAALLWQKGSAFTVCVYLSLSLQRQYRGEGDEQPIFAAPSLTRANNSVSHVSALQIIDPPLLLVPVSRCWVVVISKQRVLEFWCLDVGV